MILYSELPRGTDQFQDYLNNFFLTYYSDMKFEYNEVNNISYSESFMKISFCISLRNVGENPFPWMMNF